MASVSGGLSHAAFGGVGLGFLLGFDPLIGAAAFSLGSALAIGVLERRHRQAIDTLVAIFWSVGMALGFVFMSMKAGYAGDLTSYLFGSILYASNAHVLMIAALDVLVLGATILLFKELQAVSFEDEFTTVVGVPSGVVYAVLMTMVALTVVVLIKVVGVILAIALLSLPAASAKTWSKSLGRMMGWSTLISAFCTLTGLFASLWLGAQANIPPGPLIVLAGAAVFGGSVLAGPIRRRA
jgi:zinc transport system permease protein